VPAPLIPVAADEIAPSLPKTGSGLTVLPGIVVGVGKPSGPHDVDVIATKAEIAPSLPKTGGRLVGPPAIVVGVGKPSGPQDVDMAAEVIKLVGRGMTGIGEPSRP
jgi:hypothetical protein